MPCSLGQAKRRGESTKRRVARRKPPLRAMIPTICRNPGQRICRRLRVGHGQPPPALGHRQQSRASGQSEPLPASVRPATKSRVKIKIANTSGELGGRPAEESERQSLPIHDQNCLITLKREVTTKLQKASTNSSAVMDWERRLVRISWLETHEVSLSPIEPSPSQAE